MPTKDATGPEGRGPMTGRGLGPCAKPQYRTLLYRNKEFPMRISQRGYRRRGRSRRFGASRPGRHR